MDVFNRPLSRRRLFQAGVATAAVTVTGCAFQKPGETPAASGGGSGSPDSAPVLKLATGFAIQNLVPQKTGFWGNEFGYAELLLRPQPDGKPTDWLLEDAVNDDELTWRLTLKKDLTFQNGSPLGVEQLAAVMTWHLANTKTVSELLPGATVTVDGDNTLVLRTQAPSPQLRNILADESCFTIFDLKAYEGTGDDAQKLLDAKIYTGPYVPVSLTDEKLVMTANPTHWAGTPPLVGVEVLFVSDAGARIKAVQNGEVDIALYPPTQQAKSLEGDDRAKYSLGEPGGASFCINMNLEKAVFADAKVRRAVLRLIDYEALAKDVMQGFYEPVSSLYDPKSPYAIDIWKTDVAEAETLLTEAGATKQESGWVLSNGEPLAFEFLTYPQQPDSDTLALAIQSQLKEHGIQASIRQVPDTTAEMEGDNWDAAIVSNGTVSFGGSPIPPLQRYWRTGGNRNYSHISDPELDKLIDELAVTLDEKAAHDLLVAIQQRIGEQGYNGFCGRRRPSVVVGPRVPNYTPQHALIWVDSATRMGA